MLRWVTLHFSDDIFDRHLFAVVVGVLGVAVSATQMAAAGPHKDGGKASEARFALDTIEDLIDFNHTVAVLQSISEIQTFKVSFRLLNWGGSHDL